MKRRDIWNQTNQLKTWYSFLTSFLCLIIGISISWIISNFSENFINLLSLIIANLFSTIFIILFLYLDIREISIIKLHVKNRWIKLYFFSCFLYVILIFLIILTAIIVNDYFASQAKFDNSININLFYGLQFGFTVIFSITALLINLYAKYQINYDIWKKKHGESQKN